MKSWYIVLSASPGLAMVAWADVEAAAADTWFYAFVPSDDFAERAASQ